MKSSDFIYWRTKLIMLQSYYEYLLMFEPHSKQINKVDVLLTRIRGQVARREKRR